MYKIVDGDSLGLIAYKFNVPKKKLKLLNHMKDNDTIRLGRKFKIPLSQKRIDDISKARYTVGSGDTLSLIAKKFHLHLKDLMKFNNIEAGTIIREGKVLKLPFSYLMSKQGSANKEIEKKIKLRTMINPKKISSQLKMLQSFGKRRLRVIATAYTSHGQQTDSTPFIAAWNNHIRPGMKMIAVSRDLLAYYGLRNGTKVHIGGLPGLYVVRDKMNKRYRRRIDIYMGLNRRKALNWGRRSVTIEY